GAGPGTVPPQCRSPRPARGSLARRSPGAGAARAAVPPPAARAGLAHALRPAHREPGAGGRALRRLQRTGPDPGADRPLRPRALRFPGRLPPTTGELLERAHGAGTARKGAGNPGLRASFAVPPQRASASGLGSGGEPPSPAPLVVR